MIHMTNTHIHISPTHAPRQPHFGQGLGQPDERLQLAGRGRDGLALPAPGAAEREVGLDELLSSLFFCVCDFGVGVGVRRVVVVGIERRQRLYIIYMYIHVNMSIHIYFMIFADLL